MYGIINILDNHNILQKNNKIKKEIALCRDSIPELVNTFKNSLLNKLSINNNKYYNRDLVQDINDVLEFYLNNIKNLNTGYNLGFYMNMKI